MSRNLRREDAPLLHAFVDSVLRFWINVDSSAQDTNSLVAMYKAAKDILAGGDTATALGINKDPGGVSPKDHLTGC
jgi:hypothetical protein